MTKFKEKLCFLKNLKQKQKKIPSLLKNYNYLKFYPGKFLKRDLFIYKNSKLGGCFHYSLKKRYYIKKNIYTNLRKALFFFKAPKLIFLYKSVRGGFLGFTGNFSGFLSLKLVLKAKQTILKYKKYCLVVASCLPYSITKKRALLFTRAGMLYNFRKPNNRKTRRKKYRKVFIMPILKFLFTFKHLFFHKFLNYFSCSFNNLKNLKNFKYALYNFFTHLYKILI